jgi:HSP20 family molecular chaperone IbpA
MASNGEETMAFLLSDPFESLFRFQQALDQFRTSSWLDSSLSGGGTYPPLNVFRRGDDADAVKAEYRDGILALFLPRAERDKPRSIKVS